MSGIDRLRAIAGAWDEWGLGGTLADIADEIERECACDADTIENIRLIVGGVIDDMERHVSGHEGADDSHVARWARELRSLRDWRDNAEPVYPMTVLLRRCKEFGVDTSDCEDGEDVLNNLIETLRQRLMPEGCEWLIEAWPKFEDDAPVKLGDMALIDGDADMVEAVQIWIHGKPVIYGDNGSQQLEKGERVRRPAVLAADGEPLEVGQTVWDTNGDELVVGALEDGGYTVTCRYADVGDGIPVHGMWSPSDLTHQRPVLDADGVPIKVGDTVWKVGTVLAIHMTVVEVSRDTVRCEYAWTDGKVYRPCCSPDTLTHAKPEPPDSWKRVEDDARWMDSGADCGMFTYTHEDLVRRCRALAERERGE